MASCSLFANVTSLTLNYQLKAQYSVGESVKLDSITVTATLTSGDPITMSFVDNAIVKISGSTNKDTNYYLDTTTVGVHTLKISYDSIIYEVDYSVVSKAAWDGVTTEEPSLTDNIYTIDTPEKLAWVQMKAEQNVIGNTSSEDVEYFKDKTLKITKDLDMGNQPWGGIYFLKNVTILGEKNGTSGAKVIISNLSNTFIWTSFGLTVKNITFNYNVNKLGTFVGVVCDIGRYCTYTNNEHSEDVTISPESSPSTTNFENVDVTGKAVSANRCVGFVGFGAYNNNSVINKVTTPTIHDVVNFKNCTSTIDMTVLNGGSSISSFFVGHSNNIDINFDTNTYSSNLGKLSFLCESCVGKVIGIGGYNALKSIIKVDDIDQGDLNSGDFKSFNITQDKHLIKVNGSSKELTTEEKTNAIGKYIDSVKVENAKKLYVSLQFTYDLGYPYLYTKYVDISSYATGESVVAPIKYQYVSTYSDAANWKNYIFFNTDKALGSTICVTISQLSATDEVLKTEIIRYANVENNA